TRGRTSPTTFPPGTRWRRGRRRPSAAAGRPGRVSWPGRPDRCGTTTATPPTSSTRAARWSPPTAADRPGEGPASCTAARCGNPCRTARVRTGRGGEEPGGGGRPASSVSDVGGAPGQGPQSRGVGRVPVAILDVVDRRAEVVDGIEDVRVAGLGVGGERRRQHLHEPERGGSQVATRGVEVGRRRVERGLVLGDRLEGRRPGGRRPGAGDGLGDPLVGGAPGRSDPVRSPPGRSPRRPSPPPSPPPPRRPPPRPPRPGAPPPPRSARRRSRSRPGPPAGP